MEYSIKKHANSLYEVDVFQPNWKLSDPTWLPLANLFKFPEHKDLCKEISMSENNGWEEDVVCYEFKTSLETLEIIIDILSDNNYYDLTEMEELLEDIKFLEDK